MRKIYLAKKEAIQSLKTPYLICRTDGSISVKILDYAGFKLNTGATLYVRFYWANTVSQPMLNVNGTGGFYIMQNGTYAKNIFEDGVYFLFYDGTYWQIVQT